MSKTPAAETHVALAPAVAGPGEDQDPDRRVVGDGVKRLTQLGVDGSESRAPLQRPAVGVDAHQQDVPPPFEHDVAELVGV